MNDFIKLEKAVVIIFKYLLYFTDSTDDPKCKIYFDQMQIIHLIV